MTDTPRFPHWPLVVALATLVIALHLMPADIFGVDLDAELFDLAHPIVFALVAFGAARYLERHQLEIGGWRLLPIVATVLGVGAFAFLSESSQMLSSRDASYGDLLRDASGILAGVLLATGMGKRPWPRTLMWAAALVVIFAASWYPGQIVAAHAMAALRFPVFARFEGPLEMRMHRRVRARLSIVEAPSGGPLDGHALLVEPVPGPALSGVSIRGTRRDIGSYDALLLDVAAADNAAIELFVRIDGHGPALPEQRHLTHHRVSHDPTTLRIPLAGVVPSAPGSSAGATVISGILVYVTGDSKTPFFLDNVRLE